MEQSDSELASEKLSGLKKDFGLIVVADWGALNSGEGGGWSKGTWSILELDKLRSALSIFTDFMGGTERFIKMLGEVTVKKASIGTHGGEARVREVTFSVDHAFDHWTVVHEFAHVWDASRDWKLSRRLERFTGGFTSSFLSALKIRFGSPDLNGKVQANEPGKRGRLPGCNARGYFYGDKPSGSDWNFNRVEDFAESVAMYVGWNGNNELSDHAHARISRYTLLNGDIDPYFHTKDNWADYRKYFYPQGGNYRNTLRWKFMDQLMKQS